METEKQFLFLNLCVCVYMCVCINSKKTFTQVIVNLNLLNALTGFSRSGKINIFKAKFSFELYIKI